MGKLKLKHEQILKVLDRLHESILDLKEIKKLTKEQLTILEQFNFFEKEKAYRTQRDSTIQRFEFCTDLFWKYLKRHLTEKTKLLLEAGGPAPVIRSAHKVKLLTEKDTEKILQMIKDRNMSSHIYKEETADQIVTNIPIYYELMKKYIDKLKPLD